MINLLNKLDILKIKDKLALDNKKIVLIVLICLAIVYVDLTFIIKLQLQVIGNVTPKVIKLKKDIGNLTKNLTMMQNLKDGKTIDKKQTGVSKTKKIISQDEIPLLLQTISDIANRNNVKIIQIDTAGYTKAQEETIAGQKLLPITVKLDLTCRYHSLGNFINELENVGQFMELQEMKIMRSSKDYFLENASLVLKTYTKK